MSDTLAEKVRAMPPDHGLIRGSASGIAFWAYRRYGADDPYCGTLVGYGPTPEIALMTDEEREAWVREEKRLG